MFKIGDFAKLTRVSVKTLHHYDTIGLFRSAQVDEITGYRYYSFEQVPRLNRILALKDLGFTLEQVARLLEREITPGELGGMLRLRQAELEQQVTKAEARLKDVAARLHQIKREGKMPEHDVLLKSVQALSIASARGVVTAPEGMREHCLALLKKVFITVERQGTASTGTTLALYHESAEEGVGVEMGVMLEGSIRPQQHGRVSYRELPAERVASVVYGGSFNAFETVGQIHADIGRWIEANGYSVSGASRELYLKPPEDYSQDGVMEIQYPVTQL